MAEQGPSLKEAKESFVSNLEGSTMLEIFGVTMILPLLILLRVISLKSQKIDRSVLTVTKTLKLWLVDFSVIIFPYLLALTVFSNYLVVIYLFLFSLFALTLWSFPRKFEFLAPEVELSLKATRKQYISLFRCTAMVTTCIAILAVDFPIFPRRFAKVETFGTALMDVGVGTFVVANGILSGQARESATKISRTKSTVRNVVPLLIIGFLRLFLTRAVDYQEHVGEYGVHWNFFFTLASVAVLSHFWKSKSTVPGLSGLLIIGVYQTALSSTGLSEFLSSNERSPNFLSSNKEGIFSSFGYFGLYLLSVDLGKLFFNGPNRTSQKGERGKIWWNWVSRLTVLNGALWFLAIFSNHYIEKVSRRTCNLAYVLWTLALDLSVILAFLVPNCFFQFPQIPSLEGLNWNMLPMFLIANVLTGLVNLSINTLESSQLFSLTVLSLYLLVLSGISSFMYSSKTSLKFW